jgi:hypothetical protein
MIASGDCSVVRRIAPELWPGLELVWVHIEIWASAGSATCGGRFSQYAEGPAPAIATAASASLPTLLEDPQAPVINTNASAAAVAILVAATGFFMAACSPHHCSSSAAIGRVVNRRLRVCP